MQIIFVLLSISRYDMIIIQNPPCLPAMIAASIISIFNGSIIIIDWHNLGYKMFEEKLGKNNILVKFSFFLEKMICRLAHKHICVSHKMKLWLDEIFYVVAVVVYDRPSRLFLRDKVSLAERHDLFCRLGYSDDKLFPFLNGVGGLREEGGVDRGEKGGEKEGVDKRGEETERKTCQTLSIKTDGNARISLREDRAKMMVSATSWTADEDFSLLLNALLKLNEIFSNENSSFDPVPNPDSDSILKFNTDPTSNPSPNSSSNSSSNPSPNPSPNVKSNPTTNDTNKINKNPNSNPYSNPNLNKILVVITGKGPLKAQFEEEVNNMSKKGELGLGSGLWSGLVQVLLGLADTVTNRLTP
jgi:hypothetical protein